MEGKVKGGESGRRGEQKRREEGGIEEEGEKGRDGEGSNKLHKCTHTKPTLEEDTTATYQHNRAHPDHTSYHSQPIQEGYTTLTKD